VRILVVGAGATGGYFGLKLAQAGRDVTFLVRPQRAEALRARGLRLTGGEGESRIDPKLVAAGAIDAPFDMVLLSVKATALDGAIADFAPAVDDDTRVIPFLNGMGHIDELNARFGESVVLAGAIRVLATLNQEGDVLVLGPGASMNIGAQDGSRSARLDQVAGELSGAGFDFSVSSDAIGGMWHKWVFIATIGALTCMMRAPVGPIVACPSGPELGPTILDEAAAVSAAAGHPLPAEQIESTRALITKPGSPLTSSMYRDMSNGYGTEVEAILGDLIARGRKLGVDTPVLDLATLHLRVYERQRERRSG
jgi:2-dehydropantoate 2-reductase